MLTCRTDFCLGLQDTVSIDFDIFREPSVSGVAMEIRETGPRLFSNFHGCHHLEYLIRLMIGWN